MIDEIVLRTSGSSVTVCASYFGFPVSVGSVEFVLTGHTVRVDLGDTYSGLRENFSFL